MRHVKLGSSESRLFDVLLCAEYPPQIVCIITSSYTGQIFSDETNSFKPVIDNT